MQAIPLKRRDMKSLNVQAPNAPRAVTAAHSLVMDNLRLRVKVILVANSLDPRTKNLLVKIVKVLYQLPGRFKGAGAYHKGGSGQPIHFIRLSACDPIGEKIIPRPRCCRKPPCQRRFPTEQGV